MFGTVVHKCCCGCGNEVVTPLSQTDWQLSFDGESISLYPSIGNRNFKCKSHYWIKNNNVIWCKKMRWPSTEGKHFNDKKRRKVFKDFFKFV